MKWFPGLKLLLILMLVIVITFCGCGGGGGGDSDGGSSFFRVEVDANFTKDKVLVSTHMYDDGEPVSGSVTINGQPVAVPYAGYVEGLAPGVDVTISCTHPSLGTFTRTLKIPTAPALTTDDDLAKWFSRENDTLTISWIPAECTYYWIAIDLFDIDDKQVPNEGGMIKCSSSPYTISKSDSDLRFTLLNKGNTATYAKVKVVGVNRVDFKDKSFFEAEGVFSNELSSKP